MSVLRVVLAATVVLFLICLPQTARSQGVVRGAGTTSCAKFADVVRNYPDEAERAYMYWAQGFMSGMNLSLYFIPDSKRTDLSDSRFDTSDQMVHLRSYCDQRPLSDYMSATLDLWKTQRAHQGLPEWPHGKRN